jgi:hypothetical protein
VAANFDADGCPSVFPMGEPWRTSARRASESGSPLLPRTRTPTSWRPRPRARLRPRPRPRSRARAAGASASLGISERAVVARPDARGARVVLATIDNVWRGRRIAFESTRPDRGRPIGRPCLHLLWGALAPFERFASASARPRPRCRLRWPVPRRHDDECELVHARGGRHRHRKLASCLRWVDRPRRI